MVCFFLVLPDSGALDTFACAGHVSTMQHAAKPIIALVCDVGLQCICRLDFTFVSQIHIIKVKLFVDGTLKTKREMLRCGVLVGATE